MGVLIVAQRDCNMYDINGPRLEISGLAFLGECFHNVSELGMKPIK
jgi:hypothetical protein